MKSGVVQVWEYKCSVRCEVFRGLDKFLSLANPVQKMQCGFLIESHSFHFLNSTDINCCYDSMAMVVNPLARISWDLGKKGPENGIGSSSLNCK